MVNALRDEDLNRFLPTALLACCAYTPEQIFNGVEYCGRCERLSPEDMSAVLFGRQQLMRQARTIIYRSILHEEHIVCDCYSCKRAAQAVTSKILDGGWFNPLARPKQNMVKPPCSKMLNLINVAFNEHAPRIFDELPKTFGLYCGSKGLLGTTPCLEVLKRSTI